MIYYIVPRLTDEAHVADVVEQVGAVGLGQEGGAEPPRPVEGAPRLGRLVPGHKITELLPAAKPTGLVQ